MSDNSGATATSASRVVVVIPDNLLPNVTLAGPTNATLSALATVVLTATASDPDGTVTKVEFYDDATKIGQKTSTPYTLTVSNVPTGLHTYTAVATDNQGATSNSTPFLLDVTEVNLPPVGTLLTPTNSFTVTQPVNIAFTAKVEYYRGATKLGQDNAPRHAWAFQIKGTTADTITA